MPFTGGWVPFTGGWVPFTGDTGVELTVVLVVSLFMALAYASELYAPSGAPTTTRLATKTKHIKLKIAARYTGNSYESYTDRFEVWC